MVKAKERNPAKHNFLIPSLFGVHLSVGSLVILLFSPPARISIPFFPKIWECKIHFLLKKKKNRKQNQTDQACCLRAACMHCHGWSFICGANIGSVRTNQFNNSAREAERKDSINSWVILLLSQYYYYINIVFIYSFIHTSKQVLNSKDAKPNKQIKAAAELAFCRSPMQTGCLISEMGRFGFVSVLFCYVTLDVTLGSPLPQFPQLLNTD